MSWKCLMGKPSRDKGARAERELTRMLPGARKVSYAWQPGTDLIWMDRKVEVKRRANPISATLEKALRQDDADMVATRADNGSWRFYLDTDTLLDMLDEARLGER